MNTQVIGIDAGRGYTKVYSDFNNIAKQTMFKSIVGDSANIDFSIYENPIYINADGYDYFVGMLAEKEGYSPTPNVMTSKTSLTVEKLIYAALNEVATSDNVKIVIGVPYSSFTKENLNEVIGKYKNKTIKITDKIKGSHKTINILDVSIFREADAALMWQIRNDGINNKPLAMVTVGFRTTEFCYFDKGLKFIDKLSTTKHLGNKTALEFVQNKLKSDNIIKETNEIDSSNDYDELKEKGYKSLSELVNQRVHETWDNLSEISVFVGGGTALNMNFDSKFTIVDDPQMSTAKGLYLIGTQIFNK